MKALKMDFGEGREPKEDFVLFDKIIEDRGSVYAVSVGKVKDRESLKVFLQKVRNFNKRFQKATHHSFAARVARGGVVFETKGDDGETGAGAVILRILQKEDFINTAVCVTRWYGGVKLHGDRFKHVQDATKYGLERAM